MHWSTCTGVGKWLHAQPSHPALSEPRALSRATVTKCRNATPHLMACWSSSRAGQQCCCGGCCLRSGELVFFNEIQINWEKIKINSTPPPPSQTVICKFARIFYFGCPLPSPVWCLWVGVGGGGLLESGDDGSSVHTCLMVFIMSGFLRSMT